MKTLTESTPARLMEAAPCTSISSTTSRPASSSFSTFMREVP
jgi:hypothetical protein